MSAGWTKEAVAQIRSKRAVPATRGKYGATKTTVDNITFDSKREAVRYSQLKLMQQAGHIRFLRWQPRYTLCALVVSDAQLDDANAGEIVNRRHAVCDYVADFEYEEPRPHAPGYWRKVVEDVKSKATRTPLYQLKKKMFESQYGVQIQEIA